MKVYKCLMDFEVINEVADSLKIYNKGGYYSLNGIPKEYYKNFIKEDNIKNIINEGDIQNINEATVEKFGESKTLLLG